MSRADEVREAVSYRLKYHDDERDVLRALVEVLGITPEMVEVLMRVVPLRNGVTKAELDAADALSDLLTAAGISGGRAVPTEEP